MSRKSKRYFQSTSWDFFVHSGLHVCPNSWDFFVHSGLHVCPYQTVFLRQCTWNWTVMSLVHIFCGAALRVKKLMDSEIISIWFDAISDRLVDVC